MLLILGLRPKENQAVRRHHCAEPIFKTTMNFFDTQQTYPSWIFSTLKTIAIASGLAAITACSLIGISARTQDSPLPIAVAHARSGTIANAGAFETSDRLFVSGHVQHFPGYHLPVTAHVDIQLIGTDGQVLADKQDDIDFTAHPRTTAGHSRRASYVASFPIEQARQAVGIRVTCHLESHPDDILPGRTKPR